MATDNPLNLPSNPPSASVTDLQQDKVRNAQIDYVFHQLRATGWPHAIAVTITAGMLWLENHSYWIALWFVALQGSHALRLFTLDKQWLQATSLPAHYPQVRTLLTLGMLSTGCLWAVVPLVFLNDAFSQTFIFVSIVMAGMVASTLPALAAFLPGYFAFIIPILLALTTRYFLLDLHAVAWLTMAFLAAIAMISRTINQIITQSITMDFHNQALLVEATDARDAAEQANRAKSRFLAAASHDLRQPLQALGMTLESLKLRMADQQPGLVPLVQQGIDSHDALSALFNALLELSRLESHQLKVQNSHLDLNGLLGPIVTEFQPAAQLKHLSLTLMGPPCTVYTDPVLFGRVIRNLLSNAIKFTERGGVSLEVQPCGNSVAIRVADTGIGISEVDQQQVFDEYHQVSNPARQREQGIGLGLSVVRKMCELLQHPISLKSTLGAGSTFTLQLPAGDANMIPVHKPGVEDALTGSRVLVIDDEPSLLTAISALLTDWGCESLTATTIEAALQLLATQQVKPDIVLSDYRLGDGVDGMQAISKIRAACKQEIPALLMSGDTDPALVKAIRAQHYFLLHKPVKPAHLRRAMRQLLNKG